MVGFFTWIEFIYAKLDFGDERRLCGITFEERAAVLLLEFDLVFELLTECNAGLFSYCRFVDGVLSYFLG